MQNTFEISLTPLLQFNTIVAKTAESAVSQHLKSIEAFTKLSLDNYYAGINTRTINDAISFAEKQPEFIKKTSELFVKESKAYANLTNQIYETTQELYSVNLKNMYVKMPKVMTGQLEIVKSTVIKKTKPKKLTPITTLKTEASPKSSVKKAQAPTKTAITAKKTPKNTSAKSKNNKPTTKTSVKEKKNAAAPIKPKEIKKPVDIKAETKKSPVEKTALESIIKPKVTATKEAVKVPFKQKEKSVSKLAKKTTMNAPVWDKPKSEPQIKLPSDEQAVLKLTPVTKPKPKAVSKKLNDRK